MLVKGKLFLCIILLAVLLVTAIGCTNSSSAPSTTKAAITTSVSTTGSQTASPKYGGTLRLIDNRSISNLGSPGEIDAPSDYYFARPSVENLVGMDNTGLPVPQLATGWQYNDAKTSLTFTLRKGVKFQDGTDFNAQAAKSCMDMYKSGLKPGVLSSVSSIDVVDDFTIRLNLKEFQPALLTSLSFDGLGRMISPTAAKSLGKDGLTHPVGTGPFKFVSFQRDVSLKFERFDSYWKGKPYLDGIEFVFVKDVMTGGMSFKAGQAEVIYPLEPKMATDLKAAGNYTIVPLRSGVIGLIGDSAHSDSPFSNIKVRQAISYAIDNTAIAKTIGKEYYLPMNQFSIPGSWWYNTSVVGYPYNPTKSKQLLAEAGYSQGLNTKITFRAGDPWKDTFSAVQDYLSAVGVKCELDAADNTRVTQVSHDGWSQQMVWFQFPATPGFDPGGAIPLVLSSKSTRYSPKSMYIPADFETILNQAIIEPDTAKRTTMFQNVTKMIIDNYCLANPIYMMCNGAAIAPSVNDLDVFTFAAQEWHPELAWMNK
jgi:peptide/nickel transport system substrate-binding protein